MIAAATTIVLQQPVPVHWEAVLVTAIPALFAMIGVLGLGYMQFGIKRHVKAIDAAVNGIEPGRPTIRESVEATGEKVEAIDAAVNGAAVGDPSIRQNVETLVDRKDLDPDKDLAPKP
jgi:hypothetical protein